MAYVAVKGGKQAIENSIKLLKISRSDGADSLEIEVIIARMKHLIDRIMCEAGLYAPRYAALALKQSEGSPEEAVFLMRAYRSTLSRSYTSLTMDCRDMRLTRRISAAFKDIPLGQILGASYDYTHRLLNFNLLDETEEELTTFKELYLQGLDSSESTMNAERVSELLRNEGIISSYENDDTDPEDITKNKLMFPTSRSARLQTLFRADTGFVTGVAYAGLRGYGFMSHPTIGELRCGNMEVEIEYPLDDNETISLGEIPFTEVESFTSAHRDADKEEDELGVDVGYGLAFGRAETKAISMSILDTALNYPVPDSPPNDEEFVLLHGEALEMGGFISHLKLPHYVTYQSKLDNIRKTRKEKGAAINDPK